MSDTLIALEGIHFTYAPNRIVLRDCDFHLRPMERVALTGTIGSGKTTLLELIVGLLRPDAGRVVVFGERRTTERDFRAVRQRVGLLFQNADDQLFCPTVAEDIAFGPLNLGKSRDEVRRIVAATLKALDLYGHEDRITHQLSGGEKRLVALATVLAMDPEVLLLDEPTSGLDPESSERVTEILMNLRQAMVIVSHDRTQLARIATKSVVLSGGRLKVSDMRKLNPSIQTAIK
jgi:cobalt/nickel transport system ATP-binding protein